MYRFKGFDSTECGDNLSALEAVVNAWMESEHPRIRHVCQSIRGEHILLSFVYEEAHEIEQVTSALPRFYDDEYIEERPTNPRIPVTPPPMPMH